MNQMIQQSAASLKAQAAAAIDVAALRLGS